MLKEITKVHPLAAYIEDWMETFQSLRGSEQIQIRHLLQPVPAQFGWDERRQSTNNQVDYLIQIICYA